MMRLKRAAPNGEAQPGEAASVGELMTREPRVCKPHDSLNDAARIMWEGDCGCVPVVGERGEVVGIVTDRDVCMAAYTQGLPLPAIAVASAMAHDIQSCRPDDPLTLAEHMMAESQVRRLPVIDDEGRLVGILSLSDIVRAATRGKKASAKRPRASDPGRLLAHITAPRPRSNRETEIQA